MIAKLSVGPIPLYHQLEQDFCARIASTEFKPGDVLPTEEQIGQSYGVSRITVRKALDALHQNGLIVRRRGVGSFVAKPRSGVHAVHLSGSLDDFLQTANRMSPEVISLAPAPAPENVARIFGIASGDQVLRLELLSSTKDGPLAHSDFFFPAWLIEVLSIADISATEPIVRTIERLAGIKVLRAEQVIEPAIAGEETGRLLDVPPTTPLLRSQRTYYASNGEAVEIATLRYHPERYSYQVELRARPYAV